MVLPERVVCKLFLSVAVVDLLPVFDVLAVADLVYQHPGITRLAIYLEQSLFQKNSGFAGLDGGRVIFSVKEKKLTRTSFCSFLGLYGQGRQHQEKKERGECRQYLKIHDLYLCRLSDPGAYCRRPPPCLPFRFNGAHDLLAVSRIAYEPVFVFGDNPIPVGCLRPQFTVPVTQPG